VTSHVEVVAVAVVEVEVEVEIEEEVAPVEDVVDPQIVVTVEDFAVIAVEAPEEIEGAVTAVVIVVIAVVVGVEVVVEEGEEEVCHPKNSLPSTGKFEYLQTSIFD
jgi:hypothetical protein